MILVHTLFVLSVIAGFGLAGAADVPTAKAGEEGAVTTVFPAPTAPTLAPTVVPGAAAALTTPPPTNAPAIAKEAPVEAARAEAPKDVPKIEVEKKAEVADGARTAAAKMLKEGVETSGDKIKSDESLNSAVDKIVDIIHQGERSINSKAEALPLPLGEKFDFLLLKIPRFAKKEEEMIKPKEEDIAGARNLNDGNPCNNCNANCPCLQQNTPVYQPTTGVNPTFMSPIPDYVDPNCPLAQLQNLQQQQLQQQLMSQIQPYRSFAGPSDYNTGSRGLDVMGNGYPQTYVQSVPMNDYYAQANNYYGNHYPVAQSGLDFYGTPYPLVASLYPEPQPGYNNNNLMYGYEKH